MNKNINVKLTFSSDTTAAKNSIKDLQQSLSNLAYEATNISGSPKLVADMNKAQDTALKLKIALKDAMNQDTGKLDFTKLQRSFKTMGLDIKSVGQNLAKMGTDGVVAFGQLTQQIQNSSTALNPLSQKLGKLGTTLANTIRWQMSSAAIQGVTRAISETITYAKELNSSLNDIRIVTGYSTDSMSRFAKEANASAKALNTSTIEYTKASLIYFQQGLSTAEVKERTDATIKLANVTGKSAQEVSEWTTAIWNNFDDGKKSLEYYLDVITKLGAATASSAEEIAGGLEKFAAIAETVGLSYEYATSMLATITAQTRQSEDVVGTALKTILSRMESLKLGEALEDGTDLGQYADNLMKVGISIKTQYGELKDANQILDEVGAKWKTLAKDEQVALAQGVAGIRQYTQFIAMMENWDTIEKNAALAESSAGTLNRQANIFSQGVEGASKRLTASVEELKNVLLDENSLTPFLEILEKIVKGASFLVETFGGLPGILLLIANIFQKQLMPAMANKMIGFGQGVKDTWNFYRGNTEKQKANMVQQATKTNRDINMQSEGDNVSALRSGIAKEELKITELLTQAEKKLTQEQLEQINLQRQLLDLKRKTALAAAGKLDQANQEVQKDYTNLTSPTPQDGQETTGQPRTPRRTVKLKARIRPKVNPEEPLTETPQNPLLEDESAPLQGTRRRLNIKTSNQKKSLKALEVPKGEAKITETEIGQMEKAATFDTRLDEAKMQFQATGKFKGIDRFVEEAGRDVNNYGTDEQKKAFETMKVNRDTINNKTLELNTAQTDLKKLDKDPGSFTSDQEYGGQKYENYEKAKKGLTDKTKALEKEIKKETNAFVKNGKQVGVLDNKTKKLQKTFVNQEKQIGKLGKSLGKQSKQQNNYNKQMDATQKFTDKIKTNLGKAADSNLSYGESFSTILAGSTQALMGITMLQQGFQSFNEADTLGEKMQSLLTILMGFGAALPAIKNLTNGFGGLVAKMAEARLAKKAAAADAPTNVAAENLEAESIDNKTDKIEENTLATQADITMDQVDNAQTNINIANDKKEMASDEKKKASGAGAALINGIKSAASLPFPANVAAIVGIVALIGAVIAMAGVSIAGGISAGKRANTSESLSKNAEQDNERASKKQEEYSGNKEKYTNYQTAYQEYQSTGEGYDKLEEAAIAMAETYEIIGGKAMVLSGRFEELSEKVAKARVEELEDVTKTTADAVDSNAKQWQFNATELDTEYSYVSGKDDKKARDIIKNSDFLKQVYSINESTGKMTANYDAFADLSTKELKEFTDEANKILTTVDADSEIAQAINALLSTEGAEKFIEQSQKLYTYSGELAAAEYTNENGEIDSYDEAFKLRKKKGEMSAEEWAGFKEEISSKDTLGYFANMEGLASQAGASEKFTFKQIYEKIKDENDGYISTKLIQAINTVSVDKNTTLQEVFDQAKASYDDIAKAGANEAARAMEKSTDEVEGFVAALRAANPVFKNNDEALYNMAENAYKAAKAIEEGAEKWDDIANDYLNPSNVYEYGNAIGSLTTTFKEMFGITGEKFDSTIMNYLNQNKTTVSNFFAGQEGSYKALLVDFSTMLAEGITDSDKVLKNATSIIQQVSENGEVGSEIDIKLNDETQKALNDPQSPLSQIVKILGISFNEKTKKYTIVTDYDGTTNSVFEERKKEIEEENKELQNSLDLRRDEQKVIDKLAQSEEQISKTKEHSYGSDYISAAKEEQAIFEEQIKANEKMIEQNEEIAKQKRKQLNSQYGYNGSNYEEVEAALVNAAQSAQGDEAREDAQDRLEEFREWVDELDEAENNIHDLTMENLDKEASIIESRLDAMDHVFEIQLDISDRELQVLERKIENALEHNNNYDFAKYLKDQENAINKSIDKATYARDSVKAILKSFDVSDKDIEDILNGDGEKLFELGLDPAVVENVIDKIDQFNENGWEAYDKAYEIIDQYSEQREKLLDDIDNMSNKVESFNSILSSMQNITDLLGQNTVTIGDQVVSIDKLIRKASTNAANTATKIAKDKYTALQDQYDSLLSQLNDEKSKKKSERNTELIGILEAQLDDVSEQLMDAEVELYSAVENNMQVHMDNFKAQIADYLEDASKEIWGKTSSELQEDYDKQKELKDLRLSEYEKTYELNKLTRKIQNEIDKTDNLQYQRLLNNLLSKANGYKSDDFEMSKNQLALLQKEIEAEQALIALEEGRNAKSTMRLQRNALGGFSYVYTADQNNVSDLTQKYEDAIYGYNQAMETMAESSEASIIQIQTAWEDAINSLDTNASDYQSQVAKINSHYIALMRFHTSELKHLFGESDSFINHHAENYGNALEMMGINTENWAISMSDLSIFSSEDIDKYTNMEGFDSPIDAFYATWESKANTTMGKINSEITKLNTNLTKQLSYLGIESLEQFGEKVVEIIGSNKKGEKSGILGGISDASKESNNLVKSMEDLSNVDLQGKLSGILEPIKQITDEAEKAYKAITAFQTLSLDNKYNATLKSDGEGGLSVTVGGKDGKATVYSFTQSDIEGKGQGQATKNTISGSNFTTTDNTMTITNDDGSVTKLTQVQDASGNKYYVKSGEVKENPKEDTPAPGGLTNNETPDLTIDTITPIEVKPDKSDQYLSGKQLTSNFDGTTVYQADEKGKMKEIKDLIDIAWDKYYIPSGNNKINIDGTDYVQITSGNNTYWVKYEDLATNDLNWSTGRYRRVPTYEDVNNSSITEVDGKLYLVNKSQTILPNTRMSIYDSNDPLSLDRYYSCLVGKEGKMSNLSSDNQKAKLYDKDTGEVKVFTKKSLGIGKARSTTISRKGMVDFKESKGDWKVESYLPNHNLIKLINNSKTDNGNYFYTNAYKNPKTDTIYIKAHEFIKEFWGPNSNEYKFAETFDTGGYTGSWGSEGRMAMLHQKEIVLNASDTENFLEAIKLVRKIASQIDLQAASMSNSAFANILSTFNVSGPSGTLDQNVTIHAEFPNVTQHNEIEEAFENLVNKASQFANRK